MAKIAFQVSARAGKLLGRENFSNSEGAVIELVKNSYDADAKNSIVIFNIVYDEIENKKTERKEKVPNSDLSSIYIIDNGEGMDYDVIKEHWMKIGTGNKESDFISDNKRIKTGAKGIGRFALDRLGYTTEMWTLSNKSENNKGYYWKMNWNQFDNSDKSISQINADITEEKIYMRNFLNDEFKGNDKLINYIEGIKESNLQNGTILKISNLKDNWFEHDINGVFGSLEALIPPKELKIPFSVFFYDTQRPKELGEVETAYYNDYDYKVLANFNAENLEVDFTVERNELDIQLIKKKYSHLYKGRKHPFDLETIEKKNFSYEKRIDKILKWELNNSNVKLLKKVGSFSFLFYYLKITVSKKENYPYKTINTKERRTILDRFGGVKIYRDSFRVRPYGDSGNDWLKLGYRRAQSPAGAGQRIGDWRVSPESTAGIIRISRKTNPLLIDKSDRGSLVENEAFDTFKKLVTGIIKEFETDRSKVLNPYYEHFKIEKEKEREREIERRAQILADKIIEKRQNNSDDYRESFKDAFKETFEEIENEQFEKSNEEVVQIRALASLGLIVSSFAHELKDVRNNANEIKSLEKIYKKLKEKNYSYISFNDGVDIINLLKNDAEKIKHWVDYSLTAIKRDKRKRKNLEFSVFFKSLDKNWKKVFKERNVKFELEDNLLSENYTFRAFEMDMRTIFSNLINNSLDSFNNLDILRDRQIKIKYGLSKGNIEIIYSDNGTGLSSIFEEKEEIFRPFITSKKDREGNEEGTGLGMYLVKEVIDDNNGIIEILEPKIGFAVKIIFPTRKT